MNYPRIRVRRAWKPKNDGPGTRPWYIELVLGPVPEGESDPPTQFLHMETTHARAVRSARDHQHQTLAPLLQRSIW